MRPKSKFHAAPKKLGNGKSNIFKRFQAAKDNVALDCAELASNFPPYKPADIKTCEDRATSLIDEFFTQLQAGKFKASDVDLFERGALKKCQEQTKMKSPLALDLVVCNEAAVSAAERIRIALKEELGKKRRSSKR